MTVSLQTLRWPVAALCLATATIWGGCSPRDPDDSQSPTGGGSPPPIQVVCTTGMIADLLTNIGGPRVTVTALMGAGVDPHTYKPGAADVETLSRAKMIFYNGLALEGKMTELFTKLGRSRPVVAVSEDIPPDKLRTPDDAHGHADPHIWFDVSLWLLAAKRVERALIEYDPDNADGYRSRGAQVAAQLQSLDGDIRRQIAEIPASRRVLVTAHDAFGYFGAAYGVEVVGLQGISTDSDYSPADIQRVANLLIDRGVKAIFVESSVSDRAIKAVLENCSARGHTVTIGGELFSDAMGQPGTPQGTYIGMVRHNVETLVKALR